MVAVVYPTGHCTHLDRFGESVDFMGQYPFSHQLHWDSSFWMSGLLDKGSAGEIVLKCYFHISSRDYKRQNMSQGCCKPNGAARSAINQNLTL